MAITMNNGFREISGADLRKLDAHRQKHGDVPAAEKQASLLGKDAARFSAAAPATPKLADPAADAIQRLTKFGNLGADLQPVRDLTDTIRPELDRAWEAFKGVDPALAAETRALTDRLWRAHNGEAADDLTAGAIKASLDALFTTYGEKMRNLPGAQYDLLADVMKNVTKATRNYAPGHHAPQAEAQAAAPAPAPEDWKAQYEALKKKNDDEQHAKDEVHMKGRLAGALGHYTSLMQNAGAVERAATPLRDAALALHDALPAGHTLIRQQMSTLAEEMNRVQGDGNARTMVAEDLAKRLRIVMDTVTAKMDGLPYDGAEWKALDGFRRAVVKEADLSASRGDQPRAWIEFWKE